MSWLWTTNPVRPGNTTTGRKIDAASIRVNHFRRLGTLADTFPAKWALRGWALIIIAPFENKRRNSKSPEVGCDFVSERIEGSVRFETACRWLVMGSEKRIAEIFREVLLR